ncbi:SpoIIE family protein phosphatase [Embleya sp. NBC_00896]|uniref:PP2C family protein-serine/threonine phosphatase n=1 Tax=Embleya sp. NBC_00896 TaxID=2975961 RepID=UPI002F90934D|nr:SpoIIE family protein phosphatase [Embleya sp. NBC_00896]
MALDEDTGCPGAVPEVDPLACAVAHLIGTDDGGWDGGAYAVLRGLLAGTPAAVGVMSPSLRYLYVNPALARMNGVPAADHLGRTIAEVLPDLEAKEDVLWAVLRDGVPRETTSSGQTRAGPPGRRWWHGAYHRLEHGGEVVGLVGVLLEVSASWRTQLELDEARRRLALLDTAAVRVGTTLDLVETCDELADLFVTEIADVAAVDVFAVEGASGTPHVPEGTIRMWRAALAARSGMEPQASVLRRPGENVDYRQGSAVPRALEERSPVVLNRLSDRDLNKQVSHPDRVAAFRAVGLHSAVALPLLARGSAIGMVTLARTGNSPAFSPEDVVLARDLAGRGAISVDNARRYAHEHDIALALQHALLATPDVPHPDIELASRYRPAGSSVEVGGDWYDAVALSGGRTLLAVGDVMGHGVEAAVEMSQFRALLRVQARANLEPHEILAAVDRTGADAGIERVATCLLVLVDPAAGTSTFASAGHLPPLLVGPGDAAELVAVPVGPPLGTGFGGYTSVRQASEPERVLVMYTDGLVERRGEDIGESLQRLLRVGLTAETPLVRLVDRLIAGMIIDKPEDDIAVLAARQRPPTG